MIEIKQHAAAGLALAFVGFASGASEAADLGPYPRSQGTPAPIYAAQPFSWSGFYLGIQGGYGFGQTDAVSAPFGTGFNQTYSYDTSGFLGGAHAGFNWQASQLVLGLETDIEASNIGGTGFGSLGAGHRTNIDWLGSLRARLGYASGNTMYYATGGLAYGGVSIDKSAGRGLEPFASYSDMRTGWTLGAGVEHAFTPNITARIEYRYTDLGGVDFMSGVGGFADHSDVTFGAVRAGLSFKF